MQLMRPSELEAAARAFPVVYVPFGLIEWHGRHLPLGNDAIKAHAILVDCAHASAGVGRRNAEFAADSIGRKAKELLLTLPPGDRAFGLPAVAPEHWWCV